MEISRLSYRNYRARASNGATALPGLQASSREDVGLLPFPDFTPLLDQHMNANTLDLVFQRNNARMQSAAHVALHST